MPAERRTWARLAALAAPDRWRGLGALALGVAAALSAVGLAGSSAWLIDRAAQRPAVLSLTVVMGLVQLLAFAKAGFRYGERLATHDVAFRMLARLRARCFAALEPLVPGAARWRDGDLLARAVDDVDRLQNLAVAVVPPLAVGAVTSVVAATAVGVLVWVDGLVLAVGLASAGVLVPLLAHALARRPSMRADAARAALSADTVDLLRAAPEVVAFGQQAAWRERLASCDAALDGAQRSLAGRRGLAEALAVLVSGGTVVALALGAIAALRGGSLSPVLVAVLPVVALAAFEATAGLPAAVGHLGGDLAAARRLFALEDEEPTRPDPPAGEAADAAFPAFFVPDLSLRGVEVRYGERPPVLSGLDLDLPAGCRVGIGGASGSGKTTLVHALLGFLPVARGRVAVTHPVAGPVPLDRLPGDALRRVVGAMLQESHVFAGTLGDNLRLARPGAAEAELWRALAVVHLDEWARALPDGLRTFMGQDGARASGGERRRLTLARVVLADFPVVLLDEPTAGLDPRTAGAVLDDVLAATAGRSVVLVSHQPGELARMDRVYRLVEGRLEPVAGAPDVTGDGALDGASDPSRRRSVTAP